jgi:hypothetical protein
MDELAGLGDPCLVDLSLRLHELRQGRGKTLGKALAVNTWLHSLKLSILHPTLGSTTLPDELALVKGLADNPSLRDLELEYKYLMSGKISFSLAKTLLSHCSIQKLALKDLLKAPRNKIDCRALSSALARNTTLRSLDLELHSHNLKAVTDGIRHNTSLACMGIKFSHDDLIDYEPLTEALKANKSLRSVTLLLPDRISRRLKTYTEISERLCHTLHGHPRLTAINFSDARHQPCERCKVPFPSGERMARAQGRIICVCVHSCTHPHIQICRNIILLIHQL